jgi:HSP20 family protein
MQSARERREAYMFSLMTHPTRSERALARRNDPFWNFGGEMETLLDRFFPAVRLPEEWIEQRDWEVTETDKEVVMRLELPGFEANEIDLRIEGDVFAVRAEQPERKEANGRREMERYEYRFTLPFGTDANAIEASYRNGILEVHLPRLPEAQPKRVEVKT